MSVMVKSYSTSGSKIGRPSLKNNLVRHLGLAWAAFRPESWVSRFFFFFFCFLSNRNIFYWFVYYKILISFLPIIASSFYFYFFILMHPTYFGLFICMLNPLLFYWASKLCPRLIKHVIMSIQWSYRSIDKRKKSSPQMISLIIGQSLGRKTINT